MLFGRVKETGEYRVDDGTLRLSRSSTVTSWRYELTGGKLRLWESADEIHDYDRVKRLTCRRE